MKLTKPISLLLGILMIVSCLSICTSAANTSDSVYTYTWNANSRYDYTNARQKRTQLMYMLMLYMEPYHIMVFTLQHFMAKCV